MFCFVFERGSSFEKKRAVVVNMGKETFHRKRERKLLFLPALQNLNSLPPSNHSPSYSFVHPSTPACIHLSHCSLIHSTNNYGVPITCLHLISCYTEAKSTPVPWPPPGAGAQGKHAGSTRRWNPKKVGSGFLERPLGPLARIATSLARVGGTICG